MSIEVVKTNKAPEAIGPYSQAIVTGSFVYTSGQIPINPQTGEVVDGGIEEQAKQVLENLKTFGSGRKQLEQGGKDHCVHKGYGQLCKSKRSICQIFFRALSRKVMR